MAADSRLTLNTEARQPDKTVVNLAVGQSDSNYKLFLAPGNVGISTYGAADIAGVPIAGYVESFIVKEVKDQSATVEQVARKLLQHFSTFTPLPKTQYHVAGYQKVGDQVEQQVWHVNLEAKKSPD
ncbi:MAG: hypothetical protein DME34_04500 [Verrucomicrobia bacterium]|nr:MAG: hypothetical protein DME34_04500 [Verrucomicrobiota bacterium]